MTSVNLTKSLESVNSKEEIFMKKRSQTMKKIIESTNSIVAGKIEKNLENIPDAEQYKQYFPLWIEAIKETFKEAIRYKTMLYHIIRKVQKKAKRSEKSKGEESM